MSRYCGRVEAIPCPLRHTHWHAAAADSVGRGESDRLFRLALAPRLRPCREPSDAAIEKPAPNP
jgi:hypothetical protein